MQFIASMSNTSLIAIAVVLLILILILTSFVLTYRHIKKLEKENERIGQLVKDQGSALEELKFNLQTLTRHFASSDKTIRFLNKSVEEIIDQQHKISQNVANTAARIEVEKKSILESLPETGSTIDAARLLKQGLSIDEVAEKTGMPSYEVEMLSAVHRLDGSKHDKPNAEKVRPKVAKAEDIKESPKPAAGSLKGSHIAGLKARNAYGMGNTLKRR